MTGWGPRVFPPSTGGGGSSQVGSGLGDPSIADTAFSDYQEIALAPATVENVVSSYTVGPKLIHLVRVEFGGTNIARYRLYLNGVISAQFATWFNGPMDFYWDFTSSAFGGLPVPAGTIIRVTATHNRPMSCDFFCRIQGIVVDGP